MVPSSLGKAPVHSSLLGLPILGRAKDSRTDAKQGARKNLLNVRISQIEFIGFYFDSCLRARFGYSGDQGWCGDVQRAGNSVNPGGENGGCLVGCQCQLTSAVYLLSNQAY